MEMIFVIREVSNHTFGLVLPAWILNPAVELRLGDTLAFRIAVELRLQSVVDEDHLGLAIA
jgi:hypothetical protein